MSRQLLLTAALLLLAASAQGMTPQRHDADGAGGTCPDAQAEARAQAAVQPDAHADPADPAAAPAAAPAPVKAVSATRAKPAARWHSFLPGMFK